MSDRQPEPGFSFRRMYLKDLSFETPVGPDVFFGEWRPEYTVKLDLKSRPANEELWEVELIATVGAKLGEDTAYLIEAHHGALVAVEESDRDALRRTLAVDIPDIMFPYLREIVDNVAVKGGFPAVGMSRPDFASWFEQADAPQTLQAGQP